jgi:fatty acid desaturase
MEQTKKYKGMWWLLFFGATAALILAIVSHWPWLTLILPFQTTAFVKAMDIM